MQPGIACLLGANGAGKSTLIKQIAGEITSDSGDIHFNGQHINGLDAVARSRMGLARTFQVSSLMPEFSVLQSVMLARQSVSGKVFRFFRPVLGDASLVDPAMAQLERVGLADRAQMRAADISHGERRQLEMAVALALEPKAFLLDEPMAGMGQSESQVMMEILRPLKGTVGILLVEHDMDVVFSLADVISVLVNGAVLMTGSPEEVRNDSRVRAAYLGDGD